MYIWNMGGQGYVHYNSAMVVKGKQETETTFVAFQEHRLQQKVVICNYLYLFVFETVWKQLEFLSVCKHYSQKNLLFCLHKQLEWRKSST